jgi:hypothetical protein
MNQKNFSKGFVYLLLTGLAGLFSQKPPRRECFTSFKMTSFVMASLLASATLAVQVQQ